MDLNSLRTLVTLLSFVLFLALMVWAWHPRRRQDFDEAALLVFGQEDSPAPMPTANPNPNPEQRTAR
jgi:cytochrome c oxidase cbb3-type subunit IV